MFKRAKFFITAEHPPVVPDRHLAICANHSQSVIYSQLTILTFALSVQGGGITPANTSRIPLKKIGASRRTALLLLHVAHRHPCSH